MLSKINAGSDRFSVNPNNFQVTFVCCSDMDLWRLAFCGRMTLAEFLQPFLYFFLVKEEQLPNQAFPYCNAIYLLHKNSDFQSCAAKDIYGWILESPIGLR